MKISIKTIAISILFITTNAFAVGDIIGSAFSYQGELMDGSSPANGDYSIQIALMLTEFPGPTAVTFREFPNVTVTNGLFTIPEVDFGDVVYDGTEYWLQLLVKNSNDPGSHIALEPRQRLSAVPYAVQAEFLAANGASNGEVLQFNGADWVGQAVTLSPWTVTASQITYTAGKVGIGTGGPNATLHISADASDDPFRVQVGSSTKLVIKNNGGMSVGTNNSSPPQGGLYVHGDVKQNGSNNGIMKYMVNFYCSNDNATATIYRQANLINSSSVSIGAGFNQAECFITFPTDISQRYWQVSAVTGSLASDGFNIGANCKTFNNTTLVCTGVKLSNGNRRTTAMMLLVY